MRLNPVHAKGNLLLPPSHEMNALFRADWMINDEGMRAKKSDPEPDFYLAQPRYLYRNIKNQVAAKKTKEIWDARRRRIAQYDSMTYHPEDRPQREGKWARMDYRRDADEFRTEGPLPGANSIYERNGQHGKIDWGFDIYARRPNFGDMTVNGGRRLYDEEHGAQPAHRRLNRDFVREIRGLFNHK